MHTGMKNLRNIGKRRKPKGIDWSMGWQRLKLGDIADFSNGINFSKEAYAQGVKIISVSNFGDRFYPDYNELEEVREDVVRESDYLQSGDIIFVRSNGNKELVGRCMLIDNPPVKVTFSGFCIRARLKNIELQNPVFWSYHFKSANFRRNMSGTAIGANIQNLSQGRLAIYETVVPDINTQNKIANILSNYDQLIENNQKQIKLLEEAAQRLYKEWFVDLKFPGYEKCKIVDGVPEGWRKVSLEMVAPILTGKKDANFGTEDGMYLFFTCAQEPIKSPSYSFDCDAVILAGNGDFNVKIYRGKFEAYQRTYVFSPMEVDNLFLLYHAVRENMKQLFQGASGSTIKFLTKKMLQKIEVYIPAEDIKQGFNIYCKNLQQRIELLEKEMQLAREARDRALSKLMKGIE